MSRPQFDRYAHHAAVDASMHGHPYGPVVNGGLIDFQDNLQRGVCPDYAGQQNLAAVAGFNNGYVQIPLQQQLAAFQATPPNVAQPAALHQAQAGVSGSCFSGPPSFIHVNGVTYKPVEGAASAVEPRAAPATIAPAGASQPTQTTGAGSAQAADPAMRPLTEDELYRAIDDRVSSRVGEYVSRKLRHYPKETPMAHHGRNEGEYRDAPDAGRDSSAHYRAASRHNAVPEERGGDVTQRSRASRHNSAPLVDRDDVEAAVERIMQANAKVASSSGSAGSRGRVPLW